MKKSKAKEPKSKKVLEQSGAAPYLLSDREIRVMLVTPSGGGPWILPKGNIAKGMDTLKSAAKEAFEEAGVIGACSNHVLGIVPIQKSSDIHAEIRFYPLEIEKVLPEWEESKIRERRLFRIDYAIRLMPTERSKDVFRNLKKYLESEHGTGN